MDDGERDALCVSIVHGAVGRKRKQGEEPHTPGYSTIAFCRHDRAEQFRESLRDHIRSVHTLRIGNGLKREKSILVKDQCDVIRVYDLPFEIEAMHRLSFPVEKRR